MSSIIPLNLLGTNQSQPQAEEPRAGPETEETPPAKESDGAATSENSSSGNASSGDGQGSGSASQQAVVTSRYRTEAAERAPQATAQSVFGALASTVMDEDTARRIALAAQEKARDAMLVDRIRTSVEPQNALQSAPAEAGDVINATADPSPRPAASTGR